MRLIREQNGFDTAAHTAYALFAFTARRRTSAFAAARADKSARAKSNSLIVAELVAELVFAMLFNGTVHTSNKFSNLLLNLCPRMCLEPFTLDTS